MLTTLWVTTPPWVYRGLARLLKLDADAIHEWLCDALGCRCE